MLLSISKYLLINLAFLLSSFQISQPTVIEGRVFWENTNTPAVNVYVYITEGVEEALTDKGGNFSIRTWKKLPADVIVKYKDQKTVRTSVNDAGKKLTIYLKQ